MDTTSLRAGAVQRLYLGNIWLNLHHQFLALQACAFAQCPSKKLGFMRLAGFGHYSLELSKIVIAMMPCPQELGVFQPNGLDGSLKLVLERL